MPVAIGTQTLGSVIRPAAFCGVVGYKPSFGAISRDGVFPFSQTLDHVGVFARSVEDAAWFGACLMGLDLRDEATGIRAGMRSLSVPLASLGHAPRLAVVKTPKWSVASEAQRANFTEAVAQLKDAGALVREVPLPKAFDEAWTVVQAIMDYDASRGFALVESRHRLQLSPPLTELLDRGKRIAPEQHAKNLARRDEYRRWLDGLYDGCDAIVTIPAAGEAPAGPRAARATRPSAPSGRWRGFPRSRCRRGAGRAACRWDCRSWGATARTSARCRSRPGARRRWA